MSSGKDGAAGDQQAQAGEGDASPAPPDKGPSLELLSPQDQEMVRQIARRIEEDGLAALSYPELEFASKGPGRPYLFDRLRAAAAQSTGGLEDDAARLLDLDVDAKLAFKLIESPLERSRIMRIGEALVERDRALDEQELRYARESPFLRVKLEEYLRLGVDPERAAARLRGERNRLEQEMEASQQQMVRINRTLKADVRALEKLEARLNRQRRASSQSAKALMRTLELEQELIDLAERVEARKGELKYVEDRLAEARHELERLENAVR
ncbi:MAG: hypothetical protein WD278_06240 [Pirellulales bacterium]